jgi:hypothetical protein
LYATSACFTAKVGNARARNNAHGLAAAHNADEASALQRVQRGLAAVKLGREKQPLVADLLSLMQFLDDKPRLFLAPRLFGYITADA